MNTSQTFTYTAQRKSYLVTLAAFILSMGVETALLTLVIVAVVHLAPISTILSIADISLFLFLVFILSYPLWTKHRLTATHVELRYGSLRLDVPRDAILSAKPVCERLTLFQPMKAQVDTKKRQLTASFSESGQILLVLKQPLSIRMNRKALFFNRILINVDAPDAFLVALDTNTHIDKRPLPVTNQVQASLVTDKQLPVITPVVDNANVAIRTEQLTRRFKTFTAVDALNMSIQQGEIYGFLGSNGAGKTTTIKMLVGLLQPDAGHVWIAGHDVWREPLATKAVTGYVADRSILYERLTGREFLNFLAQMRGLPREESEQRIHTLLDLLELSEYADRVCGGYSFGMKRKLSLAAALLHQPSVLILDEPLNGLDPRSARHLKNLLITLSQQGTTILLSTHDLSVAESLCHRVGILHRGRLLVEGSASELRELAAASNLEDVFLSLTQEQASSQQEEVVV